VLGTAAGGGDLLGSFPWLGECWTGDLVLSFDPWEGLSTAFFVGFLVPFSLGLDVFIRVWKLSLSESTRRVAPDKQQEHVEQRKTTQSPESRYHECNIVNYFMFLCDNLGWVAPALVMLTLDCRGGADLHDKAP